MQNCWLKLPRNGGVFTVIGQRSFPTHVSHTYAKEFQTFVLCPVTAAAFLPITSAEEALQISHRKLQERLRKFEDLHLKVDRVNSLMRGTRKGKERRSQRMTKADLKADVPE